MHYSECVSLLYVSGLVHESAKMKENPALQNAEHILCPIAWPSILLLLWYSCTTQQSVSQHVEKPFIISQEPSLALRVEQSGQDFVDNIWKHFFEWNLFGFYFV